MAKRKKLNKRVVILLAAFGVVLVMGGAAYYIKILPRDPEASAAAGDKAFESGKEALEKGDLEAANKYFSVANARYGEAIRADKTTPEYPYKLAQLKWQWYEGVTNLARTVRLKHAADAFTALDTAIQRQHDHVPSLKLKCELLLKGRRDALEYIGAADRLLKVKDDDHLTYFNRAQMKRRLAPTATDRSYVEEAYEDYKKATELKPDEPGYWAGMLDFLEEHMPQRLEDAYEQAIENNPQSALLYEKCGEYFLGKWRKFKDRQRTEVVTAAEEAQAEEWKKRARERFEEAKRVEPENARGSTALGAYYVQMEDFDNACKQLEEAIAIDASAHRAHVILVQVYRQQGRLDELIEVARKALTTMPLMPPEGVTNEPAKRLRVALLNRKKTLIYYLAGALLEQASGAAASEKERLLSEAQEQISELEKLDPKFPGRALLSAHVSLARRELIKAIETLESALEERTLNRPGMILLAKLYLETYPGKAKKILAVLPDITEVGILRALYEIKVHRYEEASRITKAILDSDKDDAVAKNLQLALDCLTGRAKRLPAELRLDDRTGAVLVKALLDHARGLWRENRRPEAVSLLGDLQEKQPDNRQIILELFEVYRAMEQPDKSEELLKRVAAAHKGEEDWEIFLNTLRAPDRERRLAVQLEWAKREKDPLERALALVRLYAAFGKQEQALEQLAQAVKLRPEDPRVVELRFGVAIANRPADWETAEKCVEIAAKGDFDGVGGRWYRARLLTSRGQYRQAIRLLKEVIEENPVRKRERFMLGNCYYAIGRMRKAEEVYKELAEADPTSALGAINMAKVTYSMGKPSFKVWFEKARELAPNDPRVTEWAMELAEQEASNDRLGPFIERRLEKLKRQPQALQNIRRLAGLYERSGEFAKAKQFYAAYVKQNPEKLQAADVLGGFYIRRGDYGDCDALMTGLIDDAPSDAIKSMGYTAYSNLLMRYDQQRALEALIKAVEVAPANLLARKLLARRYTEIDRTEAADKELDYVLEADPEDVEAMKLKGSVALRAHDREKALALLNRALEVEPDYLEARLDRAEVNFRLRRDEQARLDLLAARQVANGVGELVAVARYLMELGELDEAEKLLRNVLQGPYVRYEPAIRSLIEVLVRKNRWSAANGVLTNARETFPDEPYYIRAKAQMHVRRGEYDMAAAALAELVELEPDSPGVLGDYLDALIRSSQHEKVLEVSEQYLKKSRFAAVASLMRARAYARLGKEDKADEMFVAALKDAEERIIPALVNYVGRAYGDRAVEKLIDWLEHRPNDALFLINLGQLRAKRGDDAGALKNFEEAINVASNDVVKAMAWQNIGLIHQEAGEVIECEKAYLATLKLRPNYSSAINNLAYLYVDQLKQAAKGLPYAKKAESMEPRDGRVLDTYGWALALTGRYEEAEEVLVDAVRLTPGTAVIHYHLGWIYEKTDKLEGAVKQYRQARELTKADGPLYKEISDALKRVRGELD